MFDQSQHREDVPIADLLFARLELARAKSGLPFGDSPDSRGIGGASPSGGPHDGGASLVELARWVELFLPWRDRRANVPIGMRVVNAGLLERPHRLFPIGTPYIQLAVDSWAAAEAIHQALAPVAGLDEAAWAIDWWQSTHGFREIKIFPDPTELAQAISLSPEPGFGHDPDLGF
jgi:hypothetical protein